MHKIEPVISIVTKLTEKMPRFYLGLFLIFCIILGSCSRQQKDDIFILVDKEKLQIPEWSNFQHLFPEDFERTEILVNIGDLQKLNPQLRAIYDSIQQEHYYSSIKKLPGSKEIYYLAFSQYIAVRFVPTGKRQNISLKEVNELNFIPLDSATQLIPGLEYEQLEILGEIKEPQPFQFHLILVDSANVTAEIFPVETIIEEYE